MRSLEVDDGAGKTLGSRMAGDGGATFALAATPACIAEINLTIAASTQNKACTRRQASQIKAARLCASYRSRSHQQGEGLCASVAMQRADLRGPHPMPSSGLLPLLGSATRPREENLRDVLGCRAHRDLLRNVDVLTRAPLGHCLADGCI